MNWLLSFVTLALIPFLSVALDSVGGIRSRNKKYTFGTHSVEDFTIIVPIWGNVKFLENVAYLSQYGNKVILCTTGDENQEFYNDLDSIANKYGFRIFRDKQTMMPQYRAATQTARATSGTIRDRLIRNVLKTVTTMYVVPLDADSTTQEPLSLLVGELVAKKLDIASIRLIPVNRNESILTRLQFHEYDLAMRLRFIAPWLISGACQVAKTEVLRDIMDRHSLFFQGNDVEIGIVAYARKYTIGHIPFVVNTAVPASLKAWFRQRLAWSGGEVRLFLANFRFVLQHPFLWVYGSVIAIMAFPLRWFTLDHPTFPLVPMAVLYVVITIFIHWKTRDRYLFLLIPYTLFLSLVMTPLGIIWYLKMAIQDRNFGIIRPNRIV